ncbi:MAG: DEAD/DEAH box helicase [Spirochaetales bacterium]|nr:DEAD/DEAH box helicase [Spirochaetales bacterium]
MTNINYRSDAYQFIGFRIIEDEYGYDLVFSEKATDVDEMFYPVIRLFIQGQDKIPINVSPVLTTPQLCELFSSRDNSEADYEEFLSQYNFPTIYTERQAYINMTGAFASSESKMNISYPQSISSLGLINPFVMRRDGLTLISKDGECCGSLNYNMLKLYLSIENANSEWNSISQSDRYKYIEKIQYLADKAHVRLDNNLSNIKLISPQRIVPDVICTDKGYTLVCGIDDPNIDNEDFIRHFQNRKIADYIYTVRDKSGQNVKVLLNEEQHHILTDIVNQRNDDEEQLRRFISNPPPNWNDDIVDTSLLYSDRVVGWKLLEPLREISIGPFLTPWFDGNADGYDSPIIEPKIILPNDLRPKRTLIIKDNENELDYDLHIEEEIHNFSFPEIIGGYADGIIPKDYQKDGIAWMSEFYNKKSPGVILADDMGLGKTFQVLSFLQSLTNQCRIVLIVCPVSLIDNWEGEYYKFFKEQRYKIIKRTNVSRSSEYVIKLQSHNESLSDSYLFITGYESLRSNENFLKIKWDIVILDEAQRIKNPTSITNRTVRALNANFRIAVTGTPVENTFSDIWTIADFASPGLLGSHTDFKREFAVSDSDDDYEICRKGKEIRKHLGMTLLRRTKDLVLTNLPKKEIIQLSRLMPPDQDYAYHQVLSMKKNINNLSDVILVIHNLKKVSDHQSLLGSYYEPKHYSFEDTARTQLLFDILLKIKEQDEKVIVFAEFIKTQYILAAIIAEKFGIRPLIYNGSVPIGQRDSLLKRFKNKIGFNVIIMSPIAGGVGLTITEANHVIHYSRHWNPAKEDQATDRVYRIGQKKNAYVYNLIGKVADGRSFDENLDYLLSRKQDMKSATLFPTAKMDVKAEELL